MKTFATTVLVAWVAFLRFHGDCVAADRELAVQARDILHKHCYKCHGLRSLVRGYDVLDWDSLTARKPGGKRYVVPGNPDDSDLWQHLAVDKDMPPYAPKPSADELALIKRWITSSTPLPRREVGNRRFLSEATILGLVRDDLRQTPVGDRRFRRYLLIHNLHNDPSVSEDDLRLSRGAIGKLINSLSWMAQIVTPEPIDPDHTVFAFDLRDVGWDQRDLWKQILRNYPYGMTRDGDNGDKAIGEIAREIHKLTDVELSYLRADWLIVTASRPPLYHTILDLPDSTEKLERLLRIDVERDFLRDRVKRAGFSHSLVSSQNRVVERHLGTAIYWKSYDFLHSEGKGNIFQNPLGPAFGKNPHSEHAFAHDGSEIVFSLPNGMPAYLLADKTGHRINQAPIEFVDDIRKTAGTPRIVTGLSCMGCHEKGIQRFEDDVRRGMAAGASARDKVDRLYLEKKWMDHVLREDEEQFFQAISKSTRPWVKDAPSPEPIYTVAFRYNSELGAAEAAADLGVDVKTLLDAVRSDPQLIGKGLEPMLDGKKIKRSVWDSRDNKATSLFQVAAFQLKLGVPLVEAWLPE